MYGIFTYLWFVLMVNVGEYTSPMDPMGYGIHFTNMFALFAKRPKKTSIPVGIQACQAIGPLQAGHNFHIQHDDLSSVEEAFGPPMAIPKTPNRGWR